MKQQREEWKDFQETVDPQSLVFLDESGINTGMTRLYGRAPKDQRVVDAVPDVRAHTTTVLSSVRMDGTLVPCVFEGALNGNMFMEYVTRFLVPSLRPGDIVVMDNLSAHKTGGIVKAIESVGAQVRFLPLYSPDFNPIELMWSKLKSHLRKCKTRSLGLLIPAVAAALNSVSTSDIRGWFVHDGYGAC